MANYVVKMSKDGGSPYLIMDEESRNGVNSLLELLGSAAESFYLEGAHSTNDDRLKINIPSGDKYYIQISTSTDESLSITVLAFDAQGNGSNIGGAIDTIGTVYEKTAAINIAAFGVYLSAPTNPCTVTIKVAKASSSVYDSVRIQNVKDAFQDLLSVHYSSWKQAQGASHSSNADKVTVDIKNGETFKVLLVASDGAEIGGTVAGFGPIEAGQPYTFTAAADTTSVGVYLDAASAAREMFFYVIQSGFLFDEESGIPKMWKDEIDDKLEDVAVLQDYDSGVTFGFITDIHWETNWQRSPDLMEYISKNSIIDMWLNGGDTASGDGGDGTQQMK